MRSPIKYFGGKYYMTKILLANFPEEYTTFCEAFGGSAALLYATEPSPLEIYNDLGQNVYSFFKTLSDPEMFERFKSRLDLTYYSAQLRAEYIERLKNPDLSIEDRAYYYFYVNRTSYNGVGGFSVNLIVRRNMSKSVSDFLSAVDRLPEFHQRLSKVIIENRDAIELIKKYDRPGVLFYLDPPYVHSTRKSGTAYEIEMSDAQHEELIETMLSSSAKFLVSGYDNAIYDKLTRSPGWTKIDFESPNAGSDAIESIWRNY